MTDDADLLRCADATAQAAALAAGQISAVALTRATLDAIARDNPALNCYLHVAADEAMAAAHAADARRAQGRVIGPLDGITVAIKDNIDVAGMPTTAGLGLRAGRIAAADAFVVARLRAAGAVLTGKLNLHAAAMGATNHNPYFGDCHNPHRHGFTPGGSSGGAAAAVAARLCALAVGTDTMGSVRIPASYCGVVGLKATYGLISTRGAVVCSHRLDHLGPLARSVRDLQPALACLAVFDPACADGSAGAHAAPLPPPLPAPRLAAPPEADLRAAGIEPDMLALFEAQLERLAALGMPLVRVALTDYDFGRARRAGLLLCLADMLGEYGAEWAADPAAFEPELAPLLRYAETKNAAAHAAHATHATHAAHATHTTHTTHAAHAAHAAALERVDAASALVSTWLAHADVFVLPVAAQRAFAFTAPVPVHQADWCAVANMAGVPALAVPMPVAPGALPAGLQLLARAGHEHTLLAVAQRYETAAAAATAATAATD